MQKWDNLMLHNHYHKIYIYSSRFTWNNILNGHKVPLNIRSRQAGDKWHPDEGIAWRDDLLMVFILAIGKVASLGEKRSTTVEINDSYPGYDSSQGKAHQLTISDEMVPSNELTPTFTSQVTPSWTFLHLNLVCPPTSLELHTISCEVIELRPCVAWDNLCTKSTHSINTLLLISRNADYGS